MLSFLEIKNYALIEHLEIEFQPHLTIITGETGSGKSIILGALGLIQGKRADSKTVKQGTEKCVVEAHFDDIDSLGINALLNEMDIDLSTPLIMRREITASGKSRAFINDTPVNLQQMKQVAGRLIDIHSQHETLQLQESVFQLQVVDSIAHNSESLSNYQQLLADYRRQQKELQDLIDEEVNARREREFIQFQWQQLDDANLAEGEQIELEERLNVMQHSEEMKTALSNADAILNGDNGVCNQIRSAYSELRHIESYWNRAEQYLERLEEARIELKDIAADLAAAADEMDFNPNEKLQTEDRLNLLYDLERKNQCESVEELIVRRDTMLGKLELIDNYSVRIKELESEIKATLDQLTKQSNALTKQRSKVCPTIEKEILSRIIQLGIPHAQFKIQVNPTKDFTPTGRDEILFLFSANQHNQPVEISNTASGGELSRLMLVIKSVLAENSQLPTIIFDEVDTGVSGEVAQKMGKMLSQMAEHIQIMTITHLPQVASQKASHLKVEKITRKEDTITTITPLSPEQRIEEIAKMLSGANPTEAAISNAKELLGV